MKKLLYLLMVLAVLASAVLPFHIGQFGAGVAHADEETLFSITQKAFSSTYQSRVVNYNGGRYILKVTSSRPSSISIYQADANWTLGDLVSTSSFSVNDMWCRMFPELNDGIIYLAGTVNSTTTGWVGTYNIATDTWVQSTTTNATYLVSPQYYDGYFYVTPLGSTWGNKIAKCTPGNWTTFANWTFVTLPTPQQGLGGYSNCFTIFGGNMYLTQENTSTYQWRLEKWDFTDENGFTQIDISEDATAAPVISLLSIPGSSSSLTATVLPYYNSGNPYWAIKYSTDGTVWTDIAHEPIPAGTGYEQFGEAMPYGNDTIIFLYANEAAGAVGHYAVYDLSGNKIQQFNGIASYTGDWEMYYVADGDKLVFSGQSYIAYTPQINILTPWTPPVDWLTGYQYRKLVNITGQVGAGTNYQVKLLVGETSGATGENFDLGGYCNSFPTDIRFTDDDGITPLDYWLESLSGTTPNQLATFWVEVPDSLESSAIIYCYYGKTGDTSGSNGNNTFLFFDDFDDASIDTNKWTYSTGVTESSGVLALTATGANWSVAYAIGKTAVGTNTAVRAKTTRTNDGYLGEVAGLAAEYTLASNYAIYSCYKGQSATKWISSTYKTAGSLQTGGINLDTSYHIFEVFRNSTTNVLYRIADVLDITEAAQVPTANMYAWFRSLKWAGQTVQTINADWVAIRKCIATEPAFTSAGGEENSLDISNTPSSHYFGVVQPSSVYWASGSEPSSFTGNTTTKSPSSNTGSGWTDPTEAYATGGWYASITSGTPSDNTIWGNYSFTENSTVSSVRVRQDAVSEGGQKNQLRVPTGDGVGNGTCTMGKYRLPTGDGDQSAAWTNTYTDVDDYTDGSTAGDGDYMTSPTDAGGGYGYFTFGNFTVPAGATINSVAVLIRARDDTLSINNIACSLKVNGSQYVGDSNYPMTTFTRYRWEWATNPDTSSAWTVDDVNGNGANPLQQFGVKGTDFSPAFRLSICYATVDYTYADNKYINIDETTPDDTDYIIYKEDSGGYADFTFSSFSIPSDADIGYLDIYYRIADTDSEVPGTNEAHACIQVGGTVYRDEDVHQYPADGFITYYWDFDWNPQTMLDWTPEDINGTSANPLQQFGISIDDGAPDVYISMIYADTAYTASDAQIRASVSWDGGSSWSSNSTHEVDGIMDTYWSDFTSATAWTPTKLNNDNFKVKVDAYTISSAEVIYLDWIPVEVVYSSTLSDENCTGNVTNDSSFPINVLFSMGNLTGGTQWTIGANPGSNIFRMRLYISGAGNLTDYTALSATPTDLIHELAAAAHQYYEFALDTPTNNPFSDGVLKSGEMLLAAEAH